jgi:hypothetical protein
MRRPGASFANKFTCLSLPYEGCCYGHVKYSNSYIIAQGKRSLYNTHTCYYAWQSRCYVDIKPKCFNSIEHNP